MLRGNDRSTGIIEQVAALVNILGVLWTGASLIITDLPVSGETGNDGTDLTIKLR